VEIQGLPTVTLSFFDKDQNSFTGSTTLDLNQLDPVFEMDLTETHKSGEIRRTAGFWPSNNSSNQSSFNYNDTWSWSVDDPVINDDHQQQNEISEGDFLRYAASNSAITLTIKNQDGDVLQTITNVPYGTLNTDSVFYVDSPSALTESAAPIVFHYRTLDDGLNLSAWLTEKDLRKIEIDLSDADLLELVDLNDVDGDGRGDADIPSPPTTFSNQDLFHGNPNNNFYRLFDLPATIPYSLGVLQHAPIQGSPPFAIGSTYGGALNEVFDNYFISGIPQGVGSNYWSPGLEANEHPLPNPFVEVRRTSKGVDIEDMATHASAQHLTTKGSFNINSTSRAAWQSILASNYIYDWSYTRNKGTSSETTLFRLNMEESFFALPFSGHLRSIANPSWLNQEFPFEMFEDESSLLDDYPFLEDAERELAFRKSNGFNPTRDWRPSLSTGHRELSESERMSLAGHIIDLLVARGRPFYSIEEFLNSGLLEQAISRTSINTIINGTNYTAATTDSKIPPNSSAYLGQADIFSSMAPFATARSDTFYIQAKGRSLNQTSGKTEAEMHCVALVQRIPERVDGDASLVMQNANGYGRRFEVMEILWLYD
jgi:hypothetical protein